MPKNLIRNPNKIICLLASGLFLLLIGVQNAQAAIATYDFSICGSTCDTSINYFASQDDVDVFPFAGDTLNRNSHTEATDAQYTSISSSNNSRWTSADPGASDEIFMWNEMKINQTANEITQIDLTWEGFLNGGSAANFSVWVLKSGQAFGTDASWVQAGTTQSISGTSDTTMTKSITSNFSDYIGANGLLTWGVYESVSSQSLNTDYVKVDVTYSTTTLGNGASPSNVSVAPGASATDLDAFTLQAGVGTDTVTSTTIGLSSGSSGGLSFIAITSDDGSTIYCSQSNPVSDIITLTSCNIPVTTTQTQFKIQITPKSHAGMPASPGSTYAVTGTITSFTSGHSQSGADANSATVTIDNASPANVTSASGTAGDAQVSLSWTNPVDSDFHSSVVLRAASAVADTPVEGTTYIVGNTIGSATVVCVVASPTANCTNSGLTNGTAYHYKIFTRDSNANYSATGVAPTGSPFTPAPSADTTAPADITDLAVSTVSASTVGLTWTAPGDDGNSGTATTYDVRYSISLITSANFSSATAATGIPTPSLAGSSESMTVSGLSASTLYYFAMKTSDEVPNTSNISNVISTTTLAAGAPEPTPPPTEIISEPQSGPTARRISVTFSGQAYPGAKIEVLRKDTSAEDVPYLTIPLETYHVLSDGSFDLSPGALIVDVYFFALRAQDKDGRQTRILPFSVDLSTTDKLEVRDILMPPTLDFERTRVRKGDSMKIIGYATPGNKTEIEIDGKIISVATPQKTGFYSFATTTPNFSFGSHYARVKQVSSDGTESVFSASRIFQISQLLVPKADLNQDNTINITDWSIFLSRWSSKEEKSRATIDMNADGKIDIRDFSIFVGTLNL